ncbi:MAG: Na+/H+ antiporter subunit E [Candidatus Promineifilaceae bacterium]|nr:Na+/H+ antiporter subunit E [Candidatus Promineifilaceae bacterium]
MLLTNVLLALAWIALTGEFDPVNFVEGFLLGYVALWLMQPVAGSSTYFKRVRNAIDFILFFLWELLRANIRVAISVIGPSSRLRPGVVAVPLDVRSDLGITLLSNLITLTPGTLTLDISADRRVMYVHTIDLEDHEQFRRQIKQGFERRVLEVLK